ITPAHSVQPSSRRRVSGRGVGSYVGGFRGVFPWPRSPSDRVRRGPCSFRRRARSGAGLVRGPGSFTDRARSRAVLVQGPRSSGIAFATGPVVQGRVRSGRVPARVLFRRGARVGTGPGRSSAGVQGLMQGPAGGPARLGAWAV